MKVYLRGPFHLCDDNGTPIQLGAKEQALIAMLLTAPHGIRTRSWLQANLWGRGAPEQAQTSLRQAIKKIRAKLGRDSNAIFSQRERIGLDLSKFSCVNDSKHGVLLEGLDIPGEDGFEDWIRSMRCTESNGLPEAQVVQYGMEESEGLRSPKKYVVLQQPIVQTDEPMAASLVGRLCDHVCANVRHEAYMEILDVRDTSSDQISALGGHATHRPVATLQFRLRWFKNQFEITAIARDPSSCRVFWTASVAADQSERMAVDSKQLIDFGNQVVEQLTLSTSKPEQGDNGVPSLLAGVHQLFSLSPRGVGRARDLFLRESEGPDSGLALAWTAFSSAIVRAELADGSERSSKAEIIDFAERALSAEPLHPMVLALVAHVQSLILRDHEVAHENLQLARRIAPYLAMVQDISAMNAVYSGNVTAARNYANLAIFYGRFSPYRFFFDASGCIAEALNGGHQQAIRLGRRALQKRPGFMAVQRHLFASQAIIGDSASAQETLKKLRISEPEFGPKLIRKPDYPMPSSISSELLSEGFRKLELPAS